MPLEQRVKELLSVSKCLQSVHVEILPSASSNMSVCKAKLPQEEGRFETF